MGNKKKFTYTKEFLEQEAIFCEEELAKFNEGYTVEWRMQHRPAVLAKREEFLQLWISEHQEK